MKDNRSVAKVLEDIIEEIERLEIAEGVSKLRKNNPKANQVRGILKSPE
ncbi:hypothetical protein BN844_1384 [Pseudomonas sp. SHC52]|nr:hypothetical protein BN844_1384 [Pseudomonas sp. SHC52]